MAVLGMFIFRIAHIKVAISWAGNKQSTPHLQRRSIRRYFSDIRRKTQKYFCRHMVGFRVHGHIFPHTTTLTPITGMLLFIPSHYDTHSYHWHAAIYSLTLRHSLLSLAYCYLFPHTTTLTPITGMLLSIPSHYDTHSYHWHTAIYSLTLRHSLLSLASIPSHYDTHSVSPLSLLSIASHYDTHSVSPLSLLSIASHYDTHSVSPLSLLSIPSHYSTHPCHTFLSEQLYTHLYIIHTLQCMTLP